MNDLHALASFKALDEGRLQPVDKGVAVTQADRDAADEQIGALLHGDGRERLLAGKMDSLSLVQAFARHRHQSETGAALLSVNEKSVMVCPQCEGEGGYPDGLDEAACHTDCTRCDGNGWIVDIAALAQPVEAGEDGLRETCARIAEQHVGQSSTISLEYDEACKDIAAAIRDTPVE